jgi:hypothetical protein
MCCGVGPMNWPRGNSDPTSCAWKWCGRTGYVARRYRRRRPRPGSLTNWKSYSDPEHSVKNRSPPRSIVPIESRR